MWINNFLDNHSVEKVCGSTDVMKNGNFQLGKYTLLLVSTSTHFQPPVLQAEPQVPQLLPILHVLQTPGTACSGSVSPGGTAVTGGDGAGTARRAAALDSPQEPK